MGDYADILAEARIKQILLRTDLNEAGELAEHVVKHAASSAVKVQKGQVILTFDLLDSGAAPETDDPQDDPEDSERDQTVVAP